MKRKNTMTLLNPASNAKSAFYHWKTVVNYEDQSLGRDSHLLRARGVSLNLIASIMKKSITIIKKTCFWEIKTFADESVKGPQRSYGLNSDHAAFLKLETPRFTMEQRATIILKVIDFYT
jgi:hypothetical protein